jgi:4-hydroxy-3-polyprenylbenzoate decarboxylase
MSDKQNITLAYTGAGGTIVHRTLLKLLAGDDRVEHINIIASPSGRKLLQLEWGVDNPANMIPEIAGKNAKKVRILNDQDLTSPVTSGSYPTTAVIIAPLAVGALSRIASGAATDLIERAADVALKERIPLVLCVREAPLNLIHIRNMAAAAEAGAIIFPITPTFYNGQSTVEGLVEEFAHRVLSIIGLKQTSKYEWDGASTEARRAHSSPK